MAEQDSANAPESARKPGKSWDQLTDRERHGRTMRFTFTKIPYVVDLGIELLDWSVPDIVRVRLPYQARMDNSAGTHHGGVIAALVDTAGSAAAWNGHDYALGMHGATVSLTVNFLSRGGHSALVATGRCLRRGKQLCFVDVAVENDAGRDVASGSLVYQFH